MSKWREVGAGWSEKTNENKYVQFPEILHM
jgi:hypothetical protein